jgi:hypothetical protein
MMHVAKNLDSLAPLMFVAAYTDTGISKQTQAHTHAHAHALMLAHTNNHTHE